MNIRSNSQKLFPGLPRGRVCSKGKGVCSQGHQGHQPPRIIFANPVPHGQLSLCPYVGKDIKSREGGQILLQPVLWSDGAQATQIPQRHPAPLAASVPE